MLGMFLGKGMSEYLSQKGKKADSVYISGALKR